MPNTREKLIELLREVQYLGGLEEKIADHLISNGVTLDNQVSSSKWISVKDGLPQGKGEVCKNAILLMDDGLVTVGWLNENTEKAYYLDTWNDVINRVPISRCTHWMPLPQPPKGD